MVNDENEVPASLGARRNLKSLPPIQTAFVQDAPPASRWRRARPAVQGQSRVPLSPGVPPNPAPTKPVPKLEKRQSKMSLFNLFSRPNVEKARGHHESGLAVPMESPTAPVPTPPPKPPVRLNPVNPVPPRPQPERAVLRSQKGSIVKRPRQPINWDPPPLFQAYPQSIKYATLQACTASPDVLMRTHSQRQQYQAQQQKIESQHDLSMLEGDTEVKKFEKGKAAHKRLVSASIMNPPDLTTKVYVLVTSGYVLQYAGEGPSDRLPEKILQLGTESAAFACDLIPGKHWVLQISQSAKEDGTVSTFQPKSLLSRLRLQNSGAKRTASSFFLIMESAEEMDAWLTAVRREIDALGGMKCRTEVDSFPTTEPAVETELRHRTSHRYMVHRDPNRFGNSQSPANSPVQSPIDSPVIVAQDWEGTRHRKPANGSDTTSIHSSRHTSVRQSAETSSIATTIVSNEQLQLNQLRESSRLSYVSNGTSGTGTVTVTTSGGSSPATSPRVDTFQKALPEPPRAATSLRSFHMNPNTMSTNRRRSMQTLPTTNEDHSFSTNPHVKPHRHSTWGPPQGHDQHDVHPTANEYHSFSTNPLAKPQRHSTWGTPPSHNQQEVHIPASAYFSRYRGNLNSSPVKSNPATRSSSAPLVRESLLPPPFESPSTGTIRPQSTIGNLPNTSTLSAHSFNRLSGAPKPFFRPLPIRTQDASGPVVIPRRLSSLGPPPASIAAAINRSVSTPTLLLPPPPPPPLSQVPQHPPQPLRRPTSMQIRADHAPFLSSSRPTAAAYNRSVATTTSYPSANRSSSSLGTHSATSISVPRSRVQNRKSMPVMGLPPPAPPPNMPLPPPPPLTPAVRV